MSLKKFALENKTKKIPKKQTPFKLAQTFHKSLPSETKSIAYACMTRSNSFRGGRKRAPTPYDQFSHCLELITQKIARKRDCWFPFSDGLKPELALALFLEEFFVSV
jgi:hypothetical protein